MVETDLEKMFECLPKKIQEYLIKDNYGPMAQRGILSGLDYDQTRDYAKKVSGILEDESFFGDLFNYLCEWEGHT